MQTLNDLTPKERIRKECDIQAANIILHGLPNDISALLNHKKKAYDIWYRVKEFMEGTELTKQERESKGTGGGHFAKQCTTKKRVKDSEWFKEKMLIAQQQEVWIAIDAEQQNFLDDDAYDLEVDDAPTTSAIFMAKLSPAGSINRNEVGPSYDLNILSELPNVADYSRIHHVKRAHEWDVKPFVAELRDTLTKFEQELNKEVLEMKIIFEGMKTDVNACSVEKKYFQTEKKELLLENDRLLEESMSCDIMHTILHYVKDTDASS
ncbi:hypothetical protein Tco_0206884 [Tanacetum coccineum]